ncbi:tripartite-type tricarboxylate transporter receptor subunit TctC [Bradyrhizobium algeriense]|uniref:Tripartite-type tricarboxylate transporter receptor subunit TctC n=1 Tax=Bradyrhizobium algeriense TaxID=634784 RepID=A0ABU8BER6_9BRAD
MRRIKTVLGFAVGSAMLLANAAQAQSNYPNRPIRIIVPYLMHFEIVSLELALPHIKAGSVKPLAVMTDKRVTDLPDVPTIAEAGFPEATYVPWYGIYVQAGTPDAIVGKINDGINKALQNPEVQRQLSVANIPGRPMPLTDLATLMKADHEKLTKVIATSGMALQ